MRSDTVFFKGFNIIGFQVSWWICVLGAVNGLAWAGPLAMALFLAVHLKQVKTEWALIIVAGIFGAIIDSILSQTGLIRYEGNIAGFAPLWIVAMWMGFAATLNHSLVWLRGRSWLGILMGAIFGPLAYITGVEFNALEFTGDKVAVIVALALIWGGSIPFLSAWATSFSPVQESNNTERAA